MECNKCGNQMDFIEIKGVDITPKNLYNISIVNN